MGKLIYTVVIEFHDKVVDDNEINEVGEKILNGLVQQVNNEGLAPEDSETCTKSIEVAKDGLIIAIEDL